MKKKSQLALERSVDYLSDTDIIITNELNFASVNRAYYSIYYAISSFLSLKEIFTKTHSGAISNFTNIFVKTAFLV
jgi:uncharacterized protein (UPF0332 family)